MRMICFSAYAAFVEVNANSGHIKLIRFVTSEDVGTVINPQIVEAQVQGGVVQGVSLNNSSATKAASSSPAHSQIIS
jgi:CO/xanthine dehydrogenase Mo-binding subunit